MLGFVATPAIVRPAETRPTAADLAEQSLAEAVGHPTVRELIHAARESLGVLGNVPGIATTYHRLERALRSVKI